MLLRAFEPVVRLTQGEYFVPVGRRGVRAPLQPVGADRRRRAASGGASRASSTSTSSRGGGSSIGGPGYSLSGISVPYVAPGAHPQLVPHAATEVPRRQPARRGRAHGSRHRHPQPHVAALPRRRAGRQRRRLARAAERPPRAGAADVPRPRRARRRLDRLPVLVLLRLQQLAVGVLRRQRARGRLGAGDRLPRRDRRRRRGRPARSRAGSCSRRTTRSATTCAGAGTTPTCPSSTDGTPSSSRARDRTRVPTSPATT